MSYGLFYAGGSRPAKAKVRWDKFFREYEEPLVLYQNRNTYSPSATKSLLSLVKKMTPAKIKNFDGREKQRIAAARTFGKSSPYLSGRMQFCVVKMCYSVKKAGMMQYLTRYMPQKDKKDVLRKPELFGNITAEDFRKKIKSKSGNFRKGERLHYKFVLTPEKNLPPEILKIYTETFVKRLELELGIKVDWQASIHTNTAHNHVHLLVDGVGQNGKRIRIPPRFVKERLREISSQILTDMLGPRDGESVRLARENRRRAERFTEFDRAIAEESEITGSRSYPLKFERDKADENLLARLEFLKKHGFAFYDESSRSYFLKKDFDKDLKAWGRYNKFLEAKRFAERGKPFELYSSADGKIRGRVLKVYHMNDEDVNANALVVEADDKAYFVPVYKPLPKSLAGKEILFECGKSSSKGKITPRVTVLKTSVENGGGRGRSQEGLKSKKTNAGDRKFNGGNGRSQSQNYGKKTQSQNEDGFEFER